MDAGHGAGLLARFRPTRHRKAATVLAIATLMAVLAPLPSCASERGDPQPDVPSGTRQLRNLVYAKPDGTPLHLDLYVPPGDRPVPLVIWVHGGGWSNGDKEDPPICRCFGTAMRRPASNTG